MLCCALAVTEEKSLVLYLETLQLSFCSAAQTVGSAQLRGAAVWGENSGFYAGFDFKSPSAENDLCDLSLRPRPS